MSEKDIIKQLQNGNNSAFRDLYDMYFDYAIRIATVAMNNNTSHAADAVQETFIRVYQNINLYELGRPFLPWFYKILLNECNRILKNNSKIVSVGEIIESGQIETDQPFVQYEDLYQAIGALDQHNRLPIVLKYLNGFKEQEIADILEVNVNTIKSRLFKGRQKLKTFLEKQKEAN